MKFFGKVIGMFKSLKLKNMLQYNLFNDSHKEGDLFTKDGKQYEVKRGESGKTRVHRADEQINMFEPKKEKPKLTLHTKINKPAEQIDMFKPKQLSIFDKTENKKEPPKEKEPHREKPKEKKTEKQTIEEPEDIHSKVKNILDKRQESKEFKDVNDRVSGSRKEMAALRKLSAAEILSNSDIDNITQAELITKEKVLETGFDAEGARQAGEKAGVVYMKQKLFGLLASKPANTERARKLYVEFMPNVMKQITMAKTLDDIKNIGNKYFAQMYSFRSGKVILFTNYAHEILNIPKNDGTIKPEDIFGKTFVSLISMKSDTAREQWALAKQYNGTTKEDVHDAKDKALANFKDTIQKNFDFIDNKPDDALIQEAFSTAKMKAFNIGEEALRGVNYGKVDQVIKREISRLKDKDIEAYQQGMIELRNKAKADIEKRLQERIDKLDSLVKPEDWSFMGKERAARTESGEPKIHDYPPLFKIIRKNGREVKDNDVTVANITNEYGYKSVQLGHYVRDHEAKEHIKHYLGAMKDFEDALDLDIVKINQDTGLSLAIGARGSGNFLAHYESDRKIINLTKKNGDGSVSHEYGHFLDDVIGITGKIGKNQEQSPELKAAIKTLQNTISYSNNPIDKVFTPLETTVYFPNIKRIYENESYTPAEKFEKAVEYANRYRYSENVYKYIAKLEGKPTTIKVITGKTLFLDNAESFKSSYWKRPQELLARAFEAYTVDKLKEKDMYNNFLVADNDKPASIRTYPQGEERQAINQAIDKVLNIFKKERGYEKASSGEKRVDEVHENNLKKSISVFGKVMDLFKSNDKQKNSQWLKCRGLQLPKQFTIESIKSDSNILTEDDFVKPFQEKFNKSYSTSKLPDGYVSVFGKQISLFRNKGKKTPKYTEPFGNPEKYAKPPNPATPVQDNEQLDLFKAEKNKLKTNPFPGPRKKKKLRRFLIKRAKRINV